jgi:hypothetical protein
MQRKSMPKPVVILCSLLCSMLLCGSISAEVYKWVDENGKTQFSDKAPSEKHAENIEGQLKKTNVDGASKNIKTSAASSYEKNSDEKNLEEQNRQQLENRIGKQCKKMKEDIQAISRGDRGSFLDENGNEELVLERDRGKKLEEWKNSYQQYGCGKLYPLE